MNNSIMPQLRILTTDFCDSKCIYCRPSGEGNLQSSRKKSLSLDVAKKVADIYKKQGGTGCIITGCRKWKYYSDWSDNRKPFL